MRNHCARVLTILAIIGGSSAISNDPVFAQGSRETVCMTKSTAGNSRGDHAFTILVPPNLVETYASRGFSARPCEGKEAHLPKVQEKMCALAARQEKATSSFARVYGIEPSEICAMARQLAGEK